MAEEEKVPLVYIIIRKIMLLAILSAFVILMWDVYQTVFVEFK